MPISVINPLPGGLKLDGSFMGPYEACTIAMHIVGLPEERAVVNLGLTKLIKLTYIAHGWLLGATKGSISLIRERVEVWHYGPVVRELYHSLKSIKVRWDSQLPDKSDLAKLLESNDDIHPDCNEQKLVEHVVDIYGIYSAKKLIEFTHRERTPWHNAMLHGKDIIPNKEIAAYYERAFARWRSKHS